MGGWIDRCYARMIDGSMVLINGWEKGWMAIGMMCINGWRAFMAGWMIGGADESHACMDGWAT